MKFFTFIVCALVSLSAFAYEPDAYAKPVPYYDYVESLETMLDSAVIMNGWALSKDETGKFYASISHKNYEIKTALVIDENSVTIKLLSADRVNCKRSCKVDIDDVQGWLLRLRKSISYQVTLLVRDQARKSSLADS